MFPPAFGVLGRMLLRRYCSQTTAAVSQSKAAGARLLHQYSRSNAEAAAAATGWPGNFGSFLRNHKSAMVAWSTLVGLGYVSMNLRPSKIDHVEAGVVSKNLRPSEIDWVEAGVVSPVVRKQKGCGSCWAMHVVASVEALHYLKTKQSVTLSVQELIDCDTTNDGCNGGRCRRALKYIMKNGISTESSYPYMARNSTSGCKLNKAAAARISDFKLVDRTEDALEEVVAKQPVIVSLQFPDDLYSYQGGIIEHEALPGTKPDHYVLIVGYGTTADGVKYWRFKNSWGDTWGEGGFGRIRRHSGGKRGVLGMFDESAVYPVLNM